MNLLSKEKQKRTETEKELEIQRNHKSEEITSDFSETQINHLNYYNKIAKENTRCIMNNPSLKEIIRITSDESCLYQLEQKMNPKELQKLLEILPLTRVERINYKNIEIGKMRRNLAKSDQNYKVEDIDRKKGKELAKKFFE